MEQELREALIEAQREYIHFLHEEEPDQETIDKGEELRKEIIELQIKLI